MARKPKAIEKVRSQKDTRQSLKRIQPFLQPYMGYGCFIAKCLNAYVETINHEVHGDKALALSGYTFGDSTVRETFAGEFVIYRRDSKEVLFSVKRVMLDLEWEKRYSLALSREMSGLFRECIKAVTPESNELVTVAGSLLLLLNSIGLFLISIRTDKGLRLVFKERTRSTRHLEVYLGGWFINGTDARQSIG